MTQLSNILKGLIGDFQKKKSASEFFNGLAMILHVPSMLWRSKLGTVSNADECFMQFKDIALDSDGVIRVKRGQRSPNALASYAYFCKIVWPNTKWLSLFLVLLGMRIKHGMGNLHFVTYYV